MDLKSYSNTEPYSSYRDKEVLKEQVKEEKKEKAEHKQVTEGEVRQAINKYSGMDNNQLMAELAKEMARKKQDGKTGEVSSTIERIKPFLNGEQQKRLDEIMKGFL